MPRPVTLFTGQWADLPLETLVKKAKSFGYQGLELACWGDHFDVLQAVDSDKYITEKWELLLDNGLDSFAISNHLSGQAICDNIDERHKEIVAKEVWGDGDPEGVRRRAADYLATAGRAARRFFDARPGRTDEEKAKPVVVNGFTGSSIWGALYAFPPTSQEYWERGFQDFAKRFLPILEVFESVNANFALEAHPTEIAYDLASAQRAVDAVKGHRRFGFNYDPSHFGYQGVDYVKFIRDLASRIYHVHIKDVWWGKGDGSVGVFGGHTSFGDPRRFWEFRSPGRGNINFEDIIVALNDIGYAGPLSVEWEDIRMNREFGATEAAAFVKKLDFQTNTQAFDAAFARKE
ncbi:MAG: sugar phosphate isomerase/epimerase [Puniceicoccales bacterium]|jgi:sugar phosphate isomerase/epimerase|nr:sugar phosphate isomerase/epimerase [Puniceicoccales bacterium]